MKAFLYIDVYFCMNLEMNELYEFGNENFIALQSSIRCLQQENTKKEKYINYI